MKVALINQPWDRSLPSQGTTSTSIGIVTQELASRLAHNHAVTIYSPTNRYSLHKVTEVDNGIEYRGIPHTQISNLLTRPLEKVYERRYSRARSRRPFFSRRAYYFAYVWQVAADLRKQAFDIVHIHNMFQFVPVIRALNPKVKLVLHMSCEWLSQLDPALVYPAVEQVALIVGCSDHITEEVIKRFPGLAERCVTVPNGVNLDTFLVDEETLRLNLNDPPHLLFVGRVSPEKGIHDLIEAFKQVQAQLPNVQLDIVGAVGSAPPEFIVLISDDAKVARLAEYYDLKGRRDIYFDRLRAMIPPELQSQIRFRGSIPYSEMHECYRNADLLVTASLSEAFCMPIAEAMASSTPVIAARVGGIPSMVIDGETGLLFEPGNASALAEAILRLLRSDEQRVALSRAARERIARLFSWDRSALLLEKYYERLLHDNEQNSLGAALAEFLS